MTYTLMSIFFKSILTEDYFDDFNFLENRAFIHSSSMKKPQSFFLSTTYFSWASILTYIFLTFFHLYLCFFFLSIFACIYKNKESFILYTLAHTFYIQKLCVRQKSQQETCSNRNIATKIWWHFSLSPVHDEMYI